MERIVIACYKPKPGQDGPLHELLKTHVSLLQREGLATSREPLIMKASDGTIVEIFGWVSKETIETAHSHPVVQQMWADFERVCDYVPPCNVKEFSAMFPDFEPLS